MFTEFRSEASHCQKQRGMASSSGPGLSLASWWRPEAVPCRDSSPTAGSGCNEVTVTRLDCETVLEGGEPVRKCVKLYKRYVSCAGSPVKEEEQKQELVARGQGVQQLEPDLVELPSRLASAAAPPAGAGGAAGTAADGPAGPARMEDVVHSMEEFLRWAEELQEEMAPGMPHLDQVPSAASQPFCEAGTQQQQQQQHGSQQQQQVHGPEPGLALGWLSGLLFGKRRGDADGSRQQRLDPSTWREFEKDFTEV